MSMDLDELRSYGDHLDDLQGEVDLEAIISSSPPGPPPARRHVGILLAAAAALVVLAVAAGLLLDDGEAPTSTDTVGTPTTTTLQDAIEVGIDPTSWNLVLEFDPDDSISATFSGSAEELAKEVSSWPGVAAVTVIEPDRNSWIEAVGERAIKDCAPGDDCSPGLAIRTSDDAATAEVGVRLAELTSRIVATRPEFAASRVLDFLANGIGELGPEPGFDTSFLGEQQFLEELPSEATAGFPEQAAPYDVANSPTVAFGVRLETPVQASPVVATVIVPSVGDIDFDTAPIFDEYAGLAPLEAGLFGGTGSQTGGFPSNESRPARLLAPNDGSYPLGTVASWAGSRSDLQVVALAGLPDTVAAVGTTLADGTAVWQRPLSGIVVFGDASGPGAPALRLQAFATDGTTVFEFWNQQFQEPGAVEAALATPSGSSAEVLEVGELVELDAQTVTDGSTLWSFGEGGLTRYDLATREPTGFLETADALGFVLDGTTMWIGGGATMSSVDLRAMTVTSSVPFPWDLRSGRPWLPVAVDGRTWFDNTPQSPRSTIVHVDLQTGALLAEYDVEKSFHGFAHDGAFWSLGREEVSRIDLATGQLTVVPLSQPLSFPAGATDTDGTIWVADHESPSITLVRIDPTTGKTLESTEVGRWPDQLGDVVTPVAGAGTIWMPGFAEPEIARVDEETLDVTRVPATHGFVQVRVFGNEVWTLEEGVAARLDPGSGEALETVSGIDEDNLRAWYPTESALLILDFDGNLVEIPRG